MTEIRDDVGRFLPTNDEGWLVNPAAGRPLQDDWRPALDAVLAACRREVGPAFHSFYVRGSVATGSAVKGSSDLDTVLVLDDDEDERRPDWQQPLKATVLAGSPFVTDLEVVVLGRGRLVAAAADLEAADPVMAQWCFLLALGARCLAGDDVLPSLGRFRPGPEIAYVLRGLPPALFTFKDRLPKLKTNADRRRLCSWTCKRLLRSGAELAMLSDGRFTRDLPPAARQMAASLPEFAEASRQLLAWAIDPPDDLAGLERLAAELGPVLVARARDAGIALDPPALLAL